MNTGTSLLTELQAENVAPLLLAELLRESLRLGGRPQLTVTSNSMAPLLRQGDRILLEAADVATLRPGDVVVYAGSDSLISHRYWCNVRQSGTVMFLTKGDRQRGYDTPWRPEQLVGRVVARNRDGRQLLLTHGPGRRLNGHLARLAIVEMAWLPPAGVPVRGRVINLAVRLARRLVYTVAWLLAGTTNLLTGSILGQLLSTQEIA
jgi:signal peptidase I